MECRIVGSVALVLAPSQRVTGQFPSCPQFFSNHNPFDPFRLASLRAKIVRTPSRITGFGESRSSAPTGVVILSLFPRGSNAMRSKGRLKISGKHLVW